MKRKTEKQALDAVMPRVALSRRRFARRLLGAAFAVPAMMSFSTDSSSFGSATLDAQSYPSHPSTVQISMASPAVRYYCVPEDPAFRIIPPKK